MDAAKAWSLTLERYAVFLRDVIDPAVHTRLAGLGEGLAAGVWQTAEPVPYVDAVRAEYRPVRTGFTWGPRWSTAWFRVQGAVPSAAALRGAGALERRVVLRFSTDTEALLWLPGEDGAGVPHHGLDVNRDAVTLVQKARGGERIDVHVEAACNHLFGDRGLQWEGPEIHRRWNSETPGLFERCELATVDETVWRLRHAYAFALDLARQLPPDSARARQLLGALRRATNALPDDAVAAHAPGVLEALLAELGPPLGRAGGSATLCHSVGHAHIDTAWLWPIRETRRKLHRTFSTTLRLMERYPEHRFLCSQAQQYAWVEESSPALFEQIRARVAEGRWEPGGAMWVEPDCTCPSGESLIRQVLHADRYWRSRFGDDRGAQRFLYLPDTFGFPAQLPQIMRHCGLDTFITNKLHWNTSTVFPHTTFLWRGLDGSEVLAHQTPGMDYNATMTPRELVRGEATHKNKDLPSVTPGGSHGPARWLQPFGFGDGGGGPTDWNLEYARLAADCDGLPRVALSTAREFCEGLHRDVARAREADPAGVPVHEGELYLELHRGTYTSQARTKQDNAECEELLRQAEILTFAGPTRLPRDEERAAKADLDHAWKLVLLNQFHDILPGSSIGRVYEDAARDHAKVRALCERLIDAGVRRWSAAVGHGRMKRPVALFNPASRGHLGSARVISRHRHVDAEGVTVVVRDEAGGLTKAERNSEAVRATPTALESPGRGLHVKLDRAGRIVSLRCADVEVCRDGAPMAQFVLLEDRPRLWDAWDIDPEIGHKPTPLDAPAERVEVIGEGPVHAAVRFHHRLGAASRLTVTLRLDARSGVLTIEGEVDWRERHRLLRLLFPARLVGATAAVGTQFGHVTRPMGDSTAASPRFEVPAHRFVSAPLDDRVQRDLGVLLDRPRGVSLRDREIGVSLLRAPTYPDPEADQGRHTFRIGLAPGPGPDGAIAATAEAFARPLRAVELDRATLKGRGTGPVTSWAPVSVNTYRGHADIECIAPGDRDGQLVLRLSERTGRGGDAVVAWSIPLKSVVPTDALGRRLKRLGFEHDAAEGGTVLRLAPFEVVTLLATRAD
jgi:alpha-mannosidase